MKKIVYSLFLILTGVATLISCQKDESDFSLSAVIADKPNVANNSNAKVYIDPVAVNEATVYYARWHNQDYVNINGQKCTLSVNSTAAAALINRITPSNSGYTAVYPYSEGAVADPGATEATVTIPASQSYHTAQADASSETEYQVVDGPMVAYCGPEDKVLKFHNAAGIIRVHVTNTIADTLKVHYVSVESSDGSYLAGSGTVSTNTETPSLSEITSNGSKSVTLDCCDDATDKHPKIAPSGSMVFYLAVAPFSGKQLKIKVMTEDVDDDGKYKYIFSSTTTQAGGLSLDRNQISSVSMSLTADNHQELLFYGAGTKDCPFLIESEADLLTLRTVTNSNTDGYCGNRIYYKQTDNIDLSDSKYYSWGSSVCASIGDKTSESSFMANYDGDGHYVKMGITDHASGGPDYGYALFGIAGNGNTIKNLTIKGYLGNTGAKNGSMSGLVGRVTGSITIENCTNEAEISSTYASVDNIGFGGICGVVNAPGCNVVFKNCTNIGTISDNKNSAGGICGNVISCNKCSFINCKNGLDGNEVATVKLSTTNSSYLGGICGYVNTVSDSVLFDSCNNNYQIQGKSNIGGILGRTVSPCYFTKCHNNKGITLTATADAYGGGLVGYSTKSLTFFDRNTNDADITTSGKFIGGFVGYVINGILTIRGWAKNTGNIISNTDESYRGGIVGCIEGKGTAGVVLTNCINTGNVTGNQFLGGIVGYLNEGTKCTMNGCGNSGIIRQNGTSFYANIGGLIGSAYRVTGGFLIKNSYNTGNIVGRDVCGGLIGLFQFNSPSNVLYTTIYNSYCSNCTISVDHTAGFAGGIIGEYSTGSANYYNLSIHNCYVSPTMTSGSDRYKGVLYGKHTTNFKVYTENNYYINSMGATVKQTGSTATAISYDGSTLEIAATTINDVSCTHVVTALNTARSAINNGTEIYTELEGNSDLKASLTDLKEWQLKDGKIIFK